MVGLNDVVVYLVQANKKMKYTFLISKGGFCKKPSLGCLTNILKSQKPPSAKYSVGVKLYPRKRFSWNKLINIANTKKLALRTENRNFCLFCMCRCLRLRRLLHHFGLLSFAASRKYYSHRF